MSGLIRPLFLDRLIPSKWFTCNQVVICLQGSTYVIYITLLGHNNMYHRHQSVILYLSNKFVEPCIFIQVNELTLISVEK